MRTSRKPSLLLIFFSLVCAILMVVGIVCFITPIKKKGACTETVQAAVVDDIIEHSDRKVDDGMRTVADYHYPVYQFIYKGEEYTIKSSVGTDPARYEIGDELDLYINPSNPNEFYDPSDVTTYIVLGIVFGVIGLIGEVICTLFFFSKPLQNEKKE